jgi:hypothetical protein
VTVSAPDRCLVRLASISASASGSHTRGTTLVARILTIADRSALAVDSRTAPPGATSR